MVVRVLVNSLVDSLFFMMGELSVTRGKEDAHLCHARDIYNILWHYISTGLKEVILRDYIYLWKDNNVGNAILQIWFSLSFRPPTPTEFDFDEEQSTPKNTFINRRRPGMTVHIC